MYLDLVLAQGVRELWSELGGAPNWAPLRNSMPRYEYESRAEPGKEIFPHERFWTTTLMITVAWLFNAATTRPYGVRRSAIKIDFATRRHEFSKNVLYSVGDNDFRDRTCWIRQRDPRARHGMSARLTTDCFKRGLEQL